MQFSPFTTPDYSVRISTRAKRLQLRVKPPGVVEVVLPKGMSPRHIHPFVAQHTPWIHHQLDRISKLKPLPELVLPQEIHFAATGETWQADYLDQTRCKAIVEKTNRRLAIHAQTMEAQQRYLQQWLNQHAKTVLGPWLDQVSRETGLDYNRLTIRAQKTRWGSCSSKKNINVNRALMFAEPHTVRYLFIHELCHTVHMNHSAKYWALVARFEPAFRQHERALNRLARHIPQWALPVQNN